MAPETPDDTSDPAIRQRDTVRIGRYAIEIESSDARIFDAVRSSLDTIAMMKSASVPDVLNGPGATAAISLRLDPVAVDRGAIVLPPSKSAAAAFENVELHIDEKGSTLAVDRRSVVRIDPSGQFARGFISPAHIDKPWIVAHRIFYLSVVELLRGHGAQYIHAGCVCDGEEGVLISGGSGAGKSTLTYALARSGLSFVSDDGVFLERGKKGLHAMAFPERIKLDSRSMSFFPELSSYDCRTGKKELRVDDTRVGDVACSTSPVAILFPIRTDNTKSRIREIPKHDAFVRVLGQSIPTLQRDRVESQMTLIEKLVESCQCFEIETAQDFDAIPGSVADAMGMGE